MPEKKRQVKLVPMYVDDIEKLYDVANSVGVPFRKLLSEIANQGSDIYLATKGDLKGLLTLYNAIHSLGGLGFLMIPSTVLNKLLEENGRLEEVYAEAEELGEAVGNIYALNNPGGEEDVMGIVKLLFLDASQVSVNAEDDSLKITINAPSRRGETLRLSLRFLDSFLRTLGYEKQFEKISNTLVILLYRRGG